MNPEHFLRYIIAPVLTHMEMDSPSARALMLGTALTESRLMWLHQVGGGPARGVYQVEPDTRADIYDTYLRYRQPLLDRLIDLQTDEPLDNQLVSNLSYATAIARLVYWRRPEPLPDDADGLAAFWKRYYNTVHGKGSVEDAAPHFARAVLIVQGNG